MANVIDILINAAWTGGGTVDKAQSDLRELGNTATATSAEMAAAGGKTRQYADSLSTVGTQAPRTGLNLAGMTTKIFAVTAAITAATLSARKLYGVLKEGAELQLTQQRFDRLAESIGTTGEALERDLSIAARGMISDMEAAALATDFLALGLTKTHDEAVRLTSVAAQLGFNMNQLVLTLTNQTTMRFDALGVSVDGFEEKVEKLEQAGLDANEAFKLAFLEQAEEQIERVGSVAETTAGQIAQVEVAWLQTIEGIKLGIVEALGPTIERWAAQIDAAQQAEIAAQGYADALGNVGQQQEALESLRMAIERQNEAIQGFGLFPTQQRERLREAIAQMAAEIAFGSETIEEQNRRLEEAGFVLRDLSFELDGVTVAYEDMNEAMKGLQREAIAPFVQRDGPEMVAIMEAFTRGTDDGGETAATLAEEMEALQEAVDKLDFADFLDRAGVSDETFTRLSLAMGGSAAATEYLKEVMKDAGQVTDDLTISAEDLTAALEEQEKVREERARFFLDFQTDLTDISVREGERREEVEATHEQRRTDIVERYGTQREQAEADLQRKRIRADAKHQRNIDETRADSAERQIEFREKANIRLADLERDHLARVEDIIKNADVRLTEAAGRLDAAAVVAIQQQREAALEDEKQSYQDSRDDIQRQLDRQIAAEREAAAERIAELERYHEERKRIEDEDLAIRLQRQEDAHQARLDQIDEQEAARLEALATGADAEIEAVSQKFVDFWTGADEITQSAIEGILDDAEAFVAERIGLIPEPSETSLPGGAGPNATNLPDSFFQNVGGATFAPTINVTGGDSPAATGEAVQDVLLGLFEEFNR